MPSRYGVGHGVVSKGAACVKYWATFPHAYTACAVFWCCLPALRESAGRYYGQSTWGLGGNTENTRYGMREGFVSREEYFFGRHPLDCWCACLRASPMSGKHGPCPPPARRPGLLAVAKHCRAWESQLLTRYVQNAISKQLEQGLHRSAAV